MRFFLMMEKLVGIMALICVIAIFFLSLSDVYFQTTYVQTVMDVMLSFGLWIQAQQEQKQIQFRHQKLCSKVGGDVLNQIEVLMQSGYNTSRISTLKSLEEERNSLLAERDALLEKLSAQENINAELQLDNVACHGKLNRYVDEKRLMANETREVNANFTELKCQVAAIISDKNDCDTNLAKVEKQLNRCRKARDDDKETCKAAEAAHKAACKAAEAAQKAAYAAKKCWL
jgi:chromosome segregation ATPase